MVDIQYIKDIKEFWEEHGEFVEEIYREAQEVCNTNRPLNIDLDMYQNLIDANAVNAFSIYDEDDVFVGYASLLVIQSPLSKGEVDAKLDHIALSKEARKRGYASHIIKDIESILRDQGIKEFSIVLPCTDMHDNFAQSLGFNKSVSVHIKDLGEE